MEGPENEGNQAKDVKMHGARSVPAANEDEQADEKIEQPHDSQVVLSRKRLFGRGGEKRGFEFLTTTGKFVMYLGPKPGAVQASSDLGSPGDGGAIDHQQDIAWAYASASRGRIRRNPAGLNAVVRVEPGHPVVHNFEASALVEVNHRKDHRRQRG